MTRPTTAIAFEWELDHDCPGRAWPKANTTVNGQMVHVYALRVVERDGEQRVWVDPNGERANFEEDFELLVRVGGSEFVTTELPGLEGQWCIFAEPFGA